MDREKEKTESGLLSETERNILYVCREKGKKNAHLSPHPAFSLCVNRDRRDKSWIPGSGFTFLLSFQGA